MWEVTIVVTSLAERRIRATATRTEGAFVRTYTLATIVPQGPTAEQIATGLANQIWELYQAELTKETNEAAVVAQVAGLAATKLDAKEPA